MRVLYYVNLYRLSVLSVFTARPPTRTNHIRTMHNKFNRPNAVHDHSTAVLTTAVDGYNTSWIIFFLSIALDLYVVYVVGTETNSDFRAQVKRCDLPIRTRNRICHFQSAKAVRPRPYKRACEMLVHHSEGPLYVSTNV